MIVYTIGFAGKKAETFFCLLAENGVTRVVDIRLNNTSQLAAFAKRDDLRYFLKAICDISYEHELRLAPTAEILKAYKKKEFDWAGYEARFLALLRDRRAEALPQEKFEGACLLCSEPEATQCHRRLVAEYLQAHWDGVEIQHL